MLEDNSNLLDKVGIIACRLRALRKCNNLSQDSVAKHLGISRTAYNKYESGAIKPVRKICEIASLFNVTTDYLLGLEKSSRESQVYTVDLRTAKQIQKYMSLKQKGREIVDITLDAVYDREKMKGAAEAALKEVGSFGS